MCYICPRHILFMFFVPRPSLLRYKYKTDGLYIFCKPERPENEKEGYSSRKRLVLLVCDSDIPGVYPVEADIDLVPEKWSKHGPVNDSHVLMTGNE